MVDSIVDYVRDQAFSNWGPEDSAHLVDSPIVWKKEIEFHDAATCWAALTSVLGQNPEELPSGWSWLSYLRSVYVEIGNLMFPHKQIDKFVKGKAMTAKAAKAAGLPDFKKVAQVAYDRKRRELAADPTGTRAFAETKAESHLADLNNGEMIAALHLSTSRTEKFWDHTKGRDDSKTHVTDSALWGSLDRDEREELLRAIKDEAYERVHKRVKGFEDYLNCRVNQLPTT